MLSVPNGITSQVVQDVEEATHPRVLEEEEKEQLYYNSRDKKQCDSVSVVQSCVLTPDTSS